MKKKKKLILVDDDKMVLSAGKEALSDYFEVLTVSSGEKMFQALKVFRPDLILLDVDMPEMNGFEVIRRLKTGYSTADVPVVFLSEQNDPNCHEQGLALGAWDFVVKPFVPELLVNLLNRYFMLAQQQEEIRKCEELADRMVQEQYSGSIRLQDSLLDTLVLLAENNYHVPEFRRAGMMRGYLSAMTAEMERKKIYTQKLDVLNRDSFIASAQLHDIGKLIVRDRILRKPGKLTPEEFEAMKHHTMYGVKVIETIEKNAGKMAFFDYAKVFAATHHERWDGSGYPLGLSKEDIPMAGRILAIVDVYDALVSDRPYKQPLSHEDARSIIMAGQGTHFDPMLTDVFFSVSDIFADIRREKK